STPLDLIETGKGLKFQAERPHLVSLGSGRLSTAITLLPLPEGRTTLGHGSMDVNIQGLGVAAQHCYIENRSGVITLHPCGNLCAIDGLRVSQPVRLSQGKEPGLTPVHEEPGLTPVPKEPDLTPVHEERLTPVHEEPGLTPVRKEPGLTPVCKEPGLTPAPKEPGLTPVPKEPGLTPVPKEPGLTPVRKEPGLTPVPKEPGLTPVP
ncbi:histone-lysine N-methyltransferase 2D-like, partial [Anarrhichthys ocellatus]|uniref:histone-lysine N-methyltransferase 2D-like n=1 Tax=Anarrhichthys ocellatus TaxID=433405 RepID=UPI0012ECDC74